ncbi:MAG: hypothetical protein WAQ98_16170 [Blastocatellia bacterium]
MNRSKNKPFRKRFENFVASELLNFVEEYDRVTNRSGLVVIISPTTVSAKNIKGTAFALMNQYKKCHSTSKLMTVEMAVTDVLLDTIQIQMKNDDLANYVRAVVRHHADIIYLETPVTTLNFNEIIPLANDALLIISIRSGGIDKDLMDLENLVDANNFAGPVTIVHQEQVKKVCKHCEKIPYSFLEIDALEGVAKLLGWELELFSYPTGLRKNGDKCSKCNGNCYIGDIPVFDVFQLGSTKRCLFLQIRSLAKRFPDDDSLLGSLLKKSIQGYTTFSELIRLFPQLIEIHKTRASNG